MKLSILILASGRGTRLGGDVPKAFVRCAGVPLVIRSLYRLLAIQPGAEVILAVHPADRQAYVEPLATEYQELSQVKLVDGGDTRQESMRRAFAQSSDDCDLILIHDAARPFFSIEAAREATQRAKNVGAALLAIPATDTLKRVANGTVTDTVDRAAIWYAQTPQVIRRDQLEKAITIALRDNFSGTDDVSLCEHAGLPVSVVEGSPRNFKITTAEDLALAEHIITEEDL